VTNSHEFLEDEIREGFPIPAMIKASWAAQMEVLSEIEKVCQRHDIKYCAAFGTLLGAARHSGFIPWDDDLDISMLRDDLNVFLEHAKSELPKGYEIINYRKHGRPDDFIFRVINSTAIRFDGPFLEKYHGFPYVAGVDIFPFDYLGSDEDLIKHQKEVATKLIDYSVGVATGKYTDPLKLKKIRDYMEKIEKEFNVHVERVDILSEQLAHLTERIFSVTPKDEAKYVSLFVNLLNWNSKIPKEYYEELIEIPFENTSIPVPGNLHEVMVLTYGEHYLTPYKKGGLHDYPYYKAQEEQLNEKMKFPPCRYEYNENEIKEAFETRESKMSRQREVKEQAVGTLNLLKEVHTEIKKSMMEDNFSQALDLLAQAQEAALKIGELIDGAFSKDRLCKEKANNDNEVKTAEKLTIISAIENYCEAVFIIYNAIESCQNSKEKALNAIEESGLISGLTDEKCEDVTEFILNAYLDEMLKSVDTDLKVKKQVVFLPYKASMWDSLESVWKKADAAPDTDAYVIPIPYYEKNPDGSFAKMHYEADEFPKYVPIIHYDDYNLELEKPDVIYIHNPYDNANYVTSVHPHFYAKNLKQYTNELVYIPYFVLYEISDDDERALKNLEEFVLTPGVINADRVIVQSESMKKHYVDILSKFAGENTRPLWEKKIEGSGSPKVEKLKNTKYEDLEIPSDWDEKLKTEDGSKKKAVFYNTSLASALAGREKYLAKIKRVLKIFADNKDSITLIWRPHPLLESTLRSMRPELADDYVKIVEDYKRENFGIYDDTPDLDRAIIISDAYYGDHSSVVQLYKMTGKPIMIQNIEIE